MGCALDEIRNYTNTNLVPAGLLTSFSSFGSGPVLNQFAGN